MLALTQAVASTNMAQRRFMAWTGIVFQLWAQMKLSMFVQRAFVTAKPAELCFWELTELLDFCARDPKA